MRATFTFLFGLMVVLFIDGCAPRDEHAGCGSPKPSVRSIAEAEIPGTYEGFDQLGIIYRCIRLNADMTGVFTRYVDAPEISITEHVRWTLESNVLTVLPDTQSDFDALKANVYSSYHPDTLPYCRVLEVTEFFHHGPVCYSLVRSEDAERARTIAGKSIVAELKGNSEAE